LHCSHSIFDPLLEFSLSSCRSELFCLLLVFLRIGTLRTTESWENSLVFSSWALNDIFETVKHWIFHAPLSGGNEIIVDATGTKSSSLFDSGWGNCICGFLRELLSCLFLLSFSYCLLLLSLLLSFSDNLGFDELGHKR
jgi:hypothetical protein